MHSHCGHTIWQELAPHVSVCVAPRLGVESHPVEDFRMIVPEQARHLGWPPASLRHVEWPAASGAGGRSLWHMGLLRPTHRVAASNT